MKNADIIVAGAGLAGSAAALALARTGYSVLLADAAPAERLAMPLASRAYALSAASLHLLGKLGLGEVLAEHGCPIERVQVRDQAATGLPQSTALDFDQTELGEALGAMIEDRFLRQGLAEAIAAHPSIDFLPGMAIERIDHEPAHSRAIFAGGQSCQAALIVAADGAESRLRGLAGIRTLHHDYDQTAVTCVIGHDQPHGSIAEQVFLPGGPLAILPLPTNRCNIVWSDRAETTRRIMALSDDEFLGVLSDRIGARLTGLTLQTSRVATPLRWRVATRLHDTRLALVGDAARSVHPIAGQGLNAGLRDVAELADVIAAAHRRGQAPGEALVLEAYTSARRPGALNLALLTDAVFRLFTHGGEAGRLARGLGMRAIQSSGPMRRALMQEAAGLGGTLPALMR